MYLFVTIALSNMCVANKNNVLFFFKVTFWPEIGKIHVLGKSFLLKTQVLVSKMFPMFFFVSELMGVKLLVCAF